MINSQLVAGEEHCEDSISKGMGDQFSAPGDGHGRRVQYIKGDG